MLKRLEIENLKALGGYHELGLAPITLIYGPNSAGKSSLLQALAVLKQTLEPRAARIDIERQPLNLRGELVDLGSFGAAVHRHELERPLTFAVEFEEPPPSANRRRRPWQRGGPGYVALTFTFDLGRHSVEQRDVTVGTPEHRVRFVPSGPPSGQQELFGASEGFFRAASKDDGRAFVELVTSSRISSVNPRLREELRDALDDFLAYEARPYFYGQGFFPISPYFRNWREKETRHRPGQGIIPSPAFSPRISEMISGPARALTEVLSQMAYLGPLRAAPTRFQARSGVVYSSVGARGEHTPLLLLQQPDLLRPVNDWLERLGIHYQLDVSTVESESIGLEIGDLVVTRLHDRRSGLAVTPQDVGFGISQLLPVVVQVLSGKGRTICVEQPEIHIHPRLQAEVADLLIEAARVHDNQVIVETHSEHLMLRMQRRIRERAHDGWLTPDRIKVLYVDTDRTGVAQPCELRLDERGDFIDEWPQGFFSERLRELFSADAPPPRRQVRRREARRES